MTLGAIQVLCSVFFWKFDIHTPFRNAYNFEPYIFVMPFPPENLTPSNRPLLGYVPYCVTSPTALRPLLRYVPYCVTCLCHDLPQRVNL